MNIDIKLSFNIDVLELKLRRFGLLFCIFILSIPFNLSSQVLINEYNNTTSNQNEWIELIVTQENANLANFILFDSEISDSSPFQYNGGVEFKNVAFWNNMPKGTFIVIYLKDVDNSLLGIDKVKGRIAVEATDASLFEQKCENCSIGNWNSEAFIIDNEAELFTITHNSNNIHSLGHTSNNVGHFINNMGILAKATLSNNEALSVIPGNNELNYFAGYDELNDFAIQNTFITNGAANRLSSGTPFNYTFIDLLRSPQWLNPGPLNIIEVNNQFNLKWNKVSNTPQTDIYYSFLVIITPGNFEDDDLPKNGTNYQIGDAIGKSKVLDIIQGNKDGNVNISTSLNCGTDYTVSVILGRFRDLSKNYNLYTSNGISYNTTNFIKNTIRRENVENYNIFTDNNETVFCVKQDTNITIKTSITDINKYKFTWFKGGTMFKIGTEYGQNTKLEINESGNYFVQVSNVDGCIKNSNLLSIQINKSPSIKIYNGDKLITQDTLIEVCKDELIDLKAKTDYGTVSWYEKNNNTYTLVENDWEFDVQKNGQYVAIASEGDCRDTSDIVSVNILDYSFSIDKDLIAFYKLLNINRTIVVLVTNDSDRELIFYEDDVTITPPFKLTNLTFPLVIPANSSLKIFVLLDSDDFTSEDYFLEFKNKCNTSKKTILKAFRINDQVIVEPREVVFPKKLKCKNIDNDTIINIFNNTEGDITINADVDLPFLINNVLPAVTAKQDTLKLKVSFNPNINGVYYDTLLVTYISDGVEDYFKIPLQGEIYEPVLEIQPDSIDLGNLSYCVIQKDTTIRLTNNFSTDITIETQFNNGMVFKNLPITVPKNNYLDVDVSILTPNNGIFNFNSSFESLPCTIDNKINIKGKKSQIDYAFDKEIMNFDTIFDCDNVDYLVQTNRLRITSDEALFAGIDSIYVPFGFTTDLKLGQELFNINNFSVTFTPNSQTSYDDYMFIKYSPCGDIDSIRLSGEYRIIEYEIPDTIFYDINLVGTSQTQSVIIKNKSTSKISFSIDEIPNSNFTILDKFNKYSLDTYDDELELDIVYLSNIESQDTSILNIKFDYPCASEKKVVLISGSKVEIINDVDINFSLEKNIYHNANKELSLDLKIYSNQYDLDTFDIINAEIELEVNSFILNLLSISDSKQNPINVDYQIDNNIIKLNYDKLLESDISLRFQPLVGKGVIAPIKISKFSFEFDEMTTINLDSTEVELYGICEIEERMFSIGDKSNLTINQNNFKDATISIKTTNKENTRLEIFDYKGALINKLCDEILSIGEYTYQINDLDTGIYFVRFSNGLNSHQNRFIIVK